jgi:hypothetical protein
MIILSTPVMNWAVPFLVKMVKRRTVGIIPSWDELAKGGRILARPK